MQAAQGGYQGGVAYIYIYVDIHVCTYIYPFVLGLAVELPPQVHLRHLLGWPSNGPPDACPWRRFFSDEMGLRI